MRYVPRSSGLRKDQPITTDRDIPERWHIEQPGEFPYDSAKFPFRIVNDKGDSIAVVGDKMAELMVSSFELRDRLGTADSLVRELARALQAVEWVRNPEDRPFCPSCERLQGYSHAEDCTLYAALSRIPAHLRAPETTSIGESEDLK